MARPKGRSISKHPDFSYENLEKWAALGLNLKQMAAMLDVSNDTLERFCKEDPEVYAAIEKGRARAIISVTKTAYTLATDGKNPSMTMFWLKCRARWSEAAQKIDVTSSDGSMSPQAAETIVNVKLTEDELNQKLLELEDKLAKLR